MMKMDPVLSKIKANVKTTVAFNRIRLELFGLAFLKINKILENTEIIVLMVRVSHPPFT